MLVMGGVQNPASNSVDGSEILRAPPGIWEKTSGLNTGISTNYQPQLVSRRISGPSTAVDLMNCRFNISKQLIKQLYQLVSEISEPSNITVDGQNPAPVDR